MGGVGWGEFGGYSGVEMDFLVVGMDGGGKNAARSFVMTLWTYGPFRAYLFATGE